MHYVNKAGPNPLIYSKRRAKRLKMDYLGIGGRLREALCDTYPLRRHPKKLQFFVIYQLCMNQGIMVVPRCAKCTLVKDGLGKNFNPLLAPFKNKWLLYTRHRAANFWVQLRIGSPLENISHHIYH